MTRKTKISCDVTRDADNMLKAYCKKHERSKGYLIEKMIRKFCGDDVEATEPAKVIVEKVKAKRKVFKPPTVEQVREYCDSRCNNVNAQDFIDHYTGNGWFKGKSKVKCWKSCVHTWEKSNKPAQQGNKQFSKVTEQNIKNLEGEW